MDRPPGRESRLSTYVPFGDSRITRIFALLTAVALVLVASTSVRADEGQISDAQLAELGLGGMEMVSDAQGEQIRGKFLFGPAFTTNLFIQIQAQLTPSVGPVAAQNFAASTFFALQGANATLAFKFPTHPVFANPAVHYIP